MPDIFRFPRIVFPDLAEHQLYDHFQERDKSYIIPSGETFFIPFDDSYADKENQIIVVPFTVGSGSYVRVSRIHLWIEPSEGYPRGTRMKFRSFISEIPYQCVVYVGRYYVIPVSSYTISDAPAGVKEVHKDDMWVLTSTIVRMRFYTGDDTLLPVYSGSVITQTLPIFTGLLEIA